MTTAVSGADYATRHPLTWSKDVLEGLNVEIAEGGLRLPAHRGLHGVVSIDYNLLAQVGVSSGMPKYWKLDIFLENCLTAKSFKTLDKRYVDVAYSTQPIQLQLPTSNIDLPGGGTYTLSDMIFLVYITPFAIDLQRKERAFPTTSSENDTGYYIAILIAMAQQVANSLGPGNDPYPVRDQIRPHSHTLLTYLGTSFVS